MDRHKIEGSSNIAEVGYDYDNLTLEIKFHNGKIYQYWPITETGYNQLRTAPSVGSYFAKNIRSNSQINVKKVDPLQSDN